MARRRDLDERGDVGVGIAPGGDARDGAARRGRPPRFWEGPGGLDLTAARLLPGGRAIELRFRGGESYQVDLAALG